MTCGGGILDGEKYYLGGADLKSKSEGISVSFFISLKPTLIPLKAETKQK